MNLALITLPFSTFPAWILIIFLILGLAALTYGGDWLTAGAITISNNLKIDPIIVGLTIVSIATSMPEMATSLTAAKDNPGIALGNILGSNIANIGLILGIAALIAPLKIELRMIRKEIPILISVTILVGIFALGGGFNRMEGSILLSLTVCYLIYVIRSAKKGNSKNIQKEFDEEIGNSKNKSNLIGLLLILLGSASLTIGAEFLVGSSVEFAYRLGVSDMFIGLSIVAIGTSLPELSASIAAVRAGHGDLCAGNVVGSNLFNMLLIGGGVASFNGIHVQNKLLLIEFPALILLSASLLWIFKTNHTITKKEGVFLLFAYFTILSISALSQLGYIF
jgi:cation:H+ antiporter